MKKPNTNPRTAYARGARFERKVKADLERQGAFVVRSAGSHSPVDLVAFWEGDITWFVQCKGKKVSGPAAEKLNTMAHKYGGGGFIAYPDRKAKGGIGYQ